LDIRPNPSGIGKKTPEIVTIRRRWTVQKGGRVKPIPMIASDPHHFRPRIPSHVIIDPKPIPNKEVTRE
jgi:hypothetical protein